MEFQFKPHVKVVVDFEIGEEVLITGFSKKVDGKHTIKDIKPNYGGCESGILAHVSGYDRWVDLGWLTKIKK